MRLAPLVGTVCWGQPTARGAHWAPISRRTARRALSAPPERTLRATARRSNALPALRESAWLNQGPGNARCVLWANTKPPPGRRPATSARWEASAPPPPPAAEDGRHARRDASTRRLGAARSTPAALAPSGRTTLRRGQAAGVRVCRAGQGPWPTPPARRRAEAVNRGGSRMPVARRRARIAPTVTSAWRGHLRLCRAQVAPPSRRVE